MRSKAPDQNRKKGNRPHAATRFVMALQPRQSLARWKMPKITKHSRHADYDAQSAVERELVLRLASILWRLRRATTMETGLFEIQADHLYHYRENRQLLSDSRDVIHTFLRRADSDRNTKADNTVEFARCFLRLANLPNFALDRLSRYEATLWRQAGRILFALDALDRRKPQERTRRSCVSRPHDLMSYEPE